MANVLSQSEIDELLSALSSGADAAAPIEEEPESNVREYNFRTANKFHKEQIRTLHLVFDNFARLLSTSLSGTLRAVCEAEVLSVEEQTFGEYNNSLPSPVILAILNINPMTGGSLMEISPEIAYAMISHLFGGAAGSSGDSSKTFTEIELVIMERMIRKFTGIMVDSWEKILRVQCTLDRIETSGQFAQIVSTNETIAIITINLRIGTEQGLINICIPHLAIEPIAKQLNTKVMFSSASRVIQAQEDLIASRIMNTEVTLTAVLDRTFASVGDVSSLQIGDVIKIEHNVKNPVTVRVEHIPKFLGVVGTHSGKFAVQVVEIVKEDSEDE